MRPTAVGSFPTKDGRNTHVQFLLAEVEILLGSNEVIVKVANQFTGLLYATNYHNNDDIDFSGDTVTPFNQDKHAYPVWSKQSLNPISTQCLHSALKHCHIDSESASQSWIFIKVLNHY